MKKNLSQSLKKGLSHIQLIVQDRSSQHYFVRPDDDDYYEDPLNWFWLPTLYVHETKDQLALLLIQELQKIGFTLDTYRELDRETLVAYSFADKKRGSFYDLVCLHVVGDTIDSVWKQDGGKPGELVPLTEFAEKSDTPPSTSPVVKRAVQKLTQESQRHG